MKTHTVKIFYCPRCSKKHYDLKDNAVGLKSMEDHIQRSHPDYWPMYKSGDDDA